MHCSAFHLQLCVWQFNPCSHAASSSAATLEELTVFGEGGRQPGQFFGVRSVAVDSKGNLYTTETYEGKRLQKFVYKGVGAVARGNQGVLWPKK